MSDAFTSTNVLLVKIKLLVETVEQQNPSLLMIDGSQFIDHLLSETVILNLTESEFDFFKNQRDVYLKIYELSSKDIQQKIMAIKNSTLIELQTKCQKNQQLKKRIQPYSEHEEIKISLLDMAKQILPIKFEDVVEEHRKFVFTIGLRDELFIRFTHNKKAPESQWNRPLTLDEKIELQTLVWALTEPYTKHSPNAVISCRKFCQDTLALPDNLLSVQKNKSVENMHHEESATEEYFLSMQQCIEHIKFLCIQTKTQEECAISIKPNSKDSLMTLFFSPRDWISPRTKIHINQAVFCDFLIFELEQILNQKNLLTFDTLGLFLEKLSIVHQCSFNVEKYPDLFKLIPYMLTEISKCFKIEENKLSEIMYQKLTNCKENCKNQNSHHGGFSIEKIEAWIKPGLDHVSPKLVAEFSALIHQIFSEDNVVKQQTNLVI